MRVEVHPSDVLAERAALWIADRAWAAVADRGRFNLAVSGGSTPAAMFAALARLPLPWTQIHVFQVDERVAPDGDADRNLGDLRANLLDLVPAQPHPMDVTAADLGAAAAAFATDLHAVTGDGVLDVVHLGLGDDGHTASWPPGDPVVEMSDRDVALCGLYKGRVRMTLTVPAVNRAREVMFLVSGGGKLDALRRLLSDDPGIPAGHVRRTDTTVLSDRAAAGV